MRESAHAPRESDQHRLICLIRPSKKGVDDGERVNESVSQNAGPEISIAAMYAAPKIKKGNSGINYSSRTFIIMAVTKQNRHEHNPKPVSCY